MLGSLLALVLLAVAGCDTESPPPAPQTPSDSIIDVAQEPPSPACPHGAELVRAGIDDDQNGVLDDDEVTDERRRCLPAPVLSAREPVPSGPECAAGGTAIVSGPDDNANGVLDPDEVGDRAIICDTVVIGDYSINDDASLALLQDVTVVTGSLTVEGSWLAAVALPALQHVGGDLRVVAAQLRELDASALDRVDGSLVMRDDRWSRLSLERIALPRLARVGADLALHSTNVVALELPALAHVAGKLWLSDNSVLEDIDAPELTAIGGDLVLTGLALRDLSGLAALTRVGGRLDVTDNDALERVALPDSLEAVAAFYASGNPALSSIDLGVVRELPRGLLLPADLGALRQLRAAALERASFVQIQDTGSLSEVTLPRLARVDRDLFIARTGLASLALPGLTDVGSDLDLQGNTALAELELTALATVGDALVVRDSAPMRALALPRLTHTGELQVRNISGLRSLALPELREITGDARFEGLAELETLELGRLLRVGGRLSLEELALSELRGLSNLVEIGTLILPRATGIRSLEDLASLERVGAIEISVFGRTEMTSLGAPRLHTADTIDVSGDRELRSFDLPALEQVRVLRVSGHPVLGALELPALRLVSQKLTLAGNPRLPQCAVDAVVAALEQAPAPVIDVTGNDPEGVCD